jgi:hypothetical protein
MWKFIFRICSRHDIDEILLKLALNINESILLALKVSFTPYDIFIVKAHILELIQHNCSLNRLSGFQWNK